MYRPFCVPVKKKAGVCVCVWGGALVLEICIFFVCVCVCHLHHDLSATDWLCWDSSGLIDAE